MKTALITGILGQDGPYLAKYLLEQGYRVYGMMRRYSSPKLDNLDYLEITDKVELVAGDLNDELSIMNIVKSIHPDELYHLGAQSFVGASWDLAQTTIETNTMGTLYILNAIKQYAPHCKLYFAATSEMLGNSTINGIQDENTPFYPRSPYGISKLAGFWLCKNYRESYNLYCSSGILFNHSGPTRGMEFVTRKVSMGVARIKFGLQKHITLGNLEAQRDWCFVGDMVRGMHLMLQQETPDDYVLCSGSTHSIRELLQVAFNWAGIYDWEPHIKIDPRFKRPAEVHKLLGSCQKAKDVLGWEPEVIFEDLVRIMVDADIERVRKERRQRDETSNPE